MSLSNFRTASRSLTQKSKKNWQKSKSTFSTFMGSAVLAGIVTGSVTVAVSQLSQRPNVDPSNIDEALLLGIRNLVN
jgi:hypothetical protein